MSGQYQHQHHGRGRQNSTGHQGGAKTPRSASATSTASRKSKQAGRQQTPQAQHQPAYDKSKKGKGKPHADANQNGKQKYTRDEMAQVAALMKTFHKKSTDQIDPELVADASNDRPMSARKLMDRNAIEGKDWSNYPIPLPPQLNCNSVYAVRTALKDANNKVLLSYYSDPIIDHKTTTNSDGFEDTVSTITEVVGKEYELGVLECYDGISENDEGNFLSCDFLNPVFLSGVNLRLSDNEVAEAVIGTTEPVSAWKQNKSCFVYAPPDTILSDNDGGNRKLMGKIQAQENWKQYGSNTKTIPRKASDGSGCTPTNVLANFWCYHEEFVDVENQDITNPKNVIKLREKARIGFLFPITPVDMNVMGNVLKFIQKPTDSIGWGQVASIGDPLNTEIKPRTWDDLQATVGRYILLTNLWSSSKLGHYEVNVSTTVVQRIYDTVVEMTSGNMFVNVRRGRHAYGNLCVLQKQISLNPNDECYGMPAGDKEKPIAEVWVTQIFTCVKAQTKFDKKWDRTQITAPHQNYALMDKEEISLCKIFQMTNNKILLYMKSEQYRIMMQAFWKDIPGNGKPDHVVAMMKNQKDWNLITMKAMLVTMVSTAYDVYFQKIPTKMACTERTSRFMDLFKHYKYWFINNKCLASEAFVQRYEAKLAKEAIDPSSYIGMPVAYDGRTEANDEKAKLEKPKIHSAATATSLIIVPARASGSNNVVEVARLKAEVERQRKAIEEHRVYLENADLEKNELEQKRLADADIFFSDKGDKGKMSPETFESYLEMEGGLTPNTIEVARKYAPRFTTAAGACFGQDDSFTARLAKLQDW